HLVCLEDGKKLTTLKRHLRTRYAMTPDDYRRKWGLPRDYPMVAPNYAAYRSSLAQKIGLGAKRRSPVEPVPELVPAQGKRTRRSAAEAPAPAPSKKKRNSVRPTS
ncbi:MucR family transcriptional regulator, partial [Asaia sp. SF2.1]